MLTHAYFACMPASASPNYHLAGSFRMGEMHGSGSLSWPNGDVYEGPFVANVMQGSGTMRFGCGSVYKGEVLEGKGA
eukprot:366357-Chlamydomonas_euryale.AAC.3